MNCWMCSEQCLKEGARSLAREDNEKLLTNTLLCSSELLLSNAAPHIYDRTQSPKKANITTKVSVYKVMSRKCE